MKKEYKLKKQKLCDLCKKKEAHHIDHIDGNHKNNEKSNLQNLCVFCHSKKHGLTPEMSKLRLLVEQYESIQKTRVQLQLALFAAHQWEIKLPELEEYHKLLVKSEEQFPKIIKRQLKDYKISEWLLKQKGISYILTAKLLSRININKCPTVSSLWAYCGLAPNQKKKKGNPANWNQFLKSYCYLIGESFVKVSNKKDSIYGNLYKQFRKEYDKREDLVKAQKYVYARRKAVKIFLQHLWLNWRKLENLPISQPYVIDILKHTKIIKPQ